jgi:hypothetical protein
MGTSLRALAFTCRALACPEVVAMSPKLSRSQLSKLFEGVSKQLQGQPVEVQVPSLKLGERVQPNWLQLLGLSYDPQDDAIEIVLRRLDVPVREPREIHFDGAGGQWSALDIVDAEGVQHIVEFKEPLLLPAA